MAKFQVTCVLKGNLPVLSEGEFCFCIDTCELFIGTKKGNVKVSTENKFESLVSKLKSNTFGGFFNLKSSKSLIGETESANVVSGTYFLELERWNVKNDRTDANNTSKGINNALLWASQQGFIEVVLPMGIYLIDENTPIEPQSFMTLNLGGATLKIRDNGLVKYAIVRYQRNQKFSRITNGRIEGDKDTHDYTTIPHTHEWGYGIEVGNTTPIEGSNISYISIDNMEILNCTGDGIAMESTWGQIGEYDFAGTFEVGGISDVNGTPIVDVNKIRSSIKIDLHHESITKWGYFGLYGDGYGGIGSEINTELYDVLFYKADNTFVAATKRIMFFEEVNVPQGADYAKIVLHQSTVPSKDGCKITVRIPEFSKNVFIEKCKIHDCRRLGISVSGAKQIYIRDCEIYKMKGTAPQGAIDIEDGYRLNQYINIERNNMYDNQGYNIVVVGGRYINIIQNKLTNNSLVVGQNVEKVIINHNHLREVSCVLGGEVTFVNNQMYGTRVIIDQGDKEALIGNCIFHNSALVMGRDKAYCIQVNQCEFFSDQDLFHSFSQLGSIIGFSTEPQTISDCVIKGSSVEGTSLTGVSPGVKNGWRLSNVSFIDTKHPQGIITNLPPGVYTGCNFENSGTISFVTKTPQAEYEFNGCSFSWDAYNLFIVESSQTIAMLKVKNSTFRGGRWGSAFFLWDIGGRIEFINNVFEYPNSESTDSIINFWNETFISEYILIENNIFRSNKSMIGVNANQISSSITLIFKDNIVDTVVIKLRDEHIKKDNYINGVFDPYFYSATEPTEGFFRVGQTIKNSNPVAGGYIGWICLNEGNANNTIWEKDIVYKMDDVVSVNGKVYKCKVMSTNGVAEPSQVDSSAEWEYLSELAVFKLFGRIAE
ncbi:right-handed parallel beta-helix repeat-containing protein [Bacillus cereus]|uniref:right-handed parallel beta-helix repeat-containing protein n=1 Tax=Bacillus cereus TaxID=1396 RepID=UPI0025710FCD|nr:right-handed parallel beta-helix repeat-containing protein [Bacillus cereus]WJE24663.1 right-handed parallel beta-helix repeat-containing protein [Bacillus cereus]